jgi:cyclophilin family peptidyl-prolyl cis-trans isomerase
VRTSLLPTCACVILLAGCGGSAPHTSTGTTAPGADRFGCVKVPRPPTGPRTAPKPTAFLDVNKQYNVTISTNCGDFTIQVDPAEAPMASASFVSLAQRGFYDHTIIHRVVPDLLIQAGDPTGTGEGGPGYLTHDLPFTNTIYTDGTVGMAKTGAQPPGTAGSQFFIVTTPDSGLPGGEYALIGKVVQGLGVVNHGIGLLGNALTETPSETVVIEHASVSTTG